jgi:hypothetical protein
VRPIARRATTSLEPADRCELVGCDFLERPDVARICQDVHTSAKARIFHFKLLAALTSQSRLGQTAVLVSDDASLATVEVLGALASGMCLVKGFLNRDEAERWLGWA